jgi:hypothetical protein
MAMSNKLLSTFVGEAPSRRTTRQNFKLFAHRVGVLAIIFTTCMTVVGLFVVSK